MGKKLSAEELITFARNYCILNRPELYEYSDREFDKIEFNEDMMYILKEYHMKNV